MWRLAVSVPLLGEGKGEVPRFLLLDLLLCVCPCKRYGGDPCCRQQVIGEGTSEQW